MININKKTATAPSQREQYLKLTWNTAGKCTHTGRRGDTATCCSAAPTQTYSVAFWGVPFIFILELLTVSPHPYTWHPVKYSAVSATVSWQGEGTACKRTLNCKVLQSRIFKARCPEGFGELPLCVCLHLPLRSLTLPEVPRGKQSNMLGAGFLSFSCCALRHSLRRRGSQAWHFIASPLGSGAHLCSTQMCQLRSQRGV